MINKVIKLIFIFLIISFSNHSFSQETKFEKRIKKDIDKLSKVSGFIDNELKLYDEETILDKKNTIIIMYNHGSWKPETRREECIKGAGRIPEAISSLHNKKIGNMIIRIYRMCSGVRGLSDHHFDRVHKLFESEGNPNGFIDLIDYDGIKIYDKIQQHLRRQIVIDTIEELAEKGYNNILLSKLSAGGILSSTGFKIQGNDEEMFLNDDGEGNVRMFYLVSGVKTYQNNTQGTINYTTGQVTLTSLNIASISNIRGSASTVIELTVQPRSNDVIPVRDQILEIDVANSTVSVESDTFASGTSDGGTTYTTSSSY